MTTAEREAEVENAVLYLGGVAAKWIERNPDEWKPINWDTDISGYKVTLTVTKEF